MKNKQLPLPGIFPPEPENFVIFQFAGYHHIFHWVVRGTSTKLNLLEIYGKRMTPRERVNYGETWGSYMHSVEPITTEQARLWIRAIVKAKDFDFENWFPLTLKGETK